MSVLDMDPAASVTTTLSDRSDRVAVPCYGSARPAFVRGDGCHLFDDRGAVALDLLSGIGPCCLGHAHPAISMALSAQARTLVHTSNLFVNAPQVRLAEWLTDRTFADRVLFVNSGAESIEAAIKIARRRAHDRGETFRREIVSLSGSFHGRTCGAMSITGQSKVHKGFAPLMGDVVHLPFGDVDALARVMGPETAAVIVEPIQGEGGVRELPEGYLGHVRRLCDEHGALMVLDEIQTGMGRTGTLFAYEPSGVVPDVVCVAKALGGGVPIGAVLATAEAGDVLQPGSHGTTFGGNPLVCAAALAVCETIECEGLIERCAALGATVRGRCTGAPGIRSVRGRGLMIGLEIDGDASAVMRACMERGVVVGTAGEHVVRLLPPFVIEERQLLQGLEVVLEVVLGA